MIEKAPVSYGSFQKKITAYLDGSLSPNEHAEFEAFVRTHPDFREVVRKREEELALIKNLIPAVRPTRETLESLENEMRLSVLNLLKVEPTNFWVKLKGQWEEWINR